MPVNVSVDNLTVHALVGHNARANLSEMARLKGTRNQDYWEELSRGGSPRKVTDSPHSFKRLQAMIEGLGVQVKRNAQSELEQLPMTDREVERRSNGALRDPGGFRTQKSGLVPFKAGLFDRELVGSGDRWNHVELPEPVPNPMYSKAIALLLQEGAGTMPGTEVRIQKNGKSETARSIAIQDVEKVYLGDHQVQVKNRDGFGDDDSHDLAGGRGLQAALRTVDLGKTIESVEARLKTQLAKKKVDPQTANNLHLALRYAKSLQKNNVQPEDGYMMTKVPVMPANFRKPVEGHDGKLMLPSVNRLYSSLVSESKALQKNIDYGFEDDQLKEDRQRLYDSFGALIGARGKRPVGAFEATSIADSIGSPKIQAGTEQFDFSDTDAKGPKGGYAQDKVVKKKMELSGRTTIIPDPSLHVDEVRLPEAMAWEMYAPFVRQKMSRDYNPTRAKEEVESQSPIAIEYLKREMEERPVLANRAPSWWKYNIMAFKPKLMKSDPDDPSSEKALRMPNLVTPSFFQGDHDSLLLMSGAEGLV